MEKNTSSRWRMLWDNVKFPLLSILFAFIIGSVFIILTGNSPFVAYYALISGSMFGVSRIGETLLKMTPLVFTGLSIAFAFRCGLFNIGAEGQLIIGTLFTVTAGYIFRDLPAYVLVPLVLAAGALGGGLWAAIPGILKAKLGVHEVIVTIMLNYSALFLTNFFIRTSLNPSTLLGTEQKAHSVILGENARLANMSSIMPIFGNSSLHTGIFIAVAAALVIWFLLYKTTMGYEIRSVGHNPFAAEYGGISISKNIIKSMFISGMLAGLGGATLVSGLTFKIDQSSASAGYGFTGIAVALVGKNHPIGVLASALLFGILANGERKMQIAGIPKEVVGIIQGIIIIFIAGEAIMQYFPDLKNKFKRNKTEKPEVSQK
jgi:simple sugar transport system permease protein